MKGLSLCLVAVCVVCVSVCAADFVCQDTINTYNTLVNVGNFTGAASLTFDNNVVYIIPGNSSPYCPYCATYNGKDAVVSLFVDGFLGHFTIMNPLVNIREISTNSNVNGVPELIDFNDEGFKTFPQFGGQYFRVPVVHDFLFNPVTCLITQMHLYHDPYVASIAFTGRVTPNSPIFPQLTMVPPAVTFQIDPSTVAPGSLLNWQFIPGEDTVDSAAAWKLIQDYYLLLDSNAITQENINRFFIALDYSLPTGQAAVYVAGDNSVLPYAGVWVGQEDVYTYHMKRKSVTTEKSPLSSLTGNVQIKGSVAVHYTMKGSTLTGSKAAYSVDAIDYFQIIPQSGSLKIARLTRYFDTYAVTVAGLPNGEVFPQYSDFDVFNGAEKIAVGVLMCVLFAFFWVW